MGSPPLFFYGTLMDPDLLGFLIGRPVEPGELLPARLGGARRVRVRGASYPMLLADPRASVEGRLWHGGTAEERARLDAYEGPAWRLVPAEVELASGERVAARVYQVIEGTLEPTDEPWDLAHWQARYKPRHLAQADAPVGPPSPRGAGRSEPT